MRDITLLGAGLVGSVLAILLQQKGYQVTIYERREDMRKDNSGGGRSINLALSDRGWKTLDYAGMRNTIDAIALPMQGRYLHQEDGSSAFQAYGKNGEAIYSVSRGELNKKLMDKAEQIGVRIHFNHRCHKVDVPNNIVYLTTENGAEKTVSCDLLFGTDGAFSALKTAYSHLDRTDYEQFYLRHGYKELSIPPGPANQKWLIENDGLHIWPRHNFMMIALPNMDGSFTCTLFFPFEGELSFETIQTDKEITDFIKKTFPDAFPLMPTLLEDFRNNPVSSLVTTKIFPWKYQDKSCLLGDAAHAIVPFYGQGMNAGFEDCTVLYELMEKHPDDWTTTFTQYENLRKPNGDAIADLALFNFIEMRDKVADPVFLERKKIEKEIGRRFPQQFNSVYEMVSFSHVPYEYALKCIKAQDKLLESIQNEGGFFEKLNQDGYLTQLEEKIQEYTASLREEKNSPF